MKSTAGNKIDMISGPLTPRLLAFATPLILSGILQQSFNAVDIAVIGRYASSSALAAVGSNGPLINILVNLFIGISIGANVVIANYIGRKNNNGIRSAIGTTALLSIISGAILMIIGICLARPVLEWMSAPDNVIDLATEYLEIYFLGMPFMMIYNFGSAIMRSMGDTKRPFYSLLVAAVANVGFNMLFVAMFSLGVAGVAYGTVIANAINAGFIVWWLMHEAEPYRLRVKSMRINKSELKKMLQIGVPAGIQGMVFSGANLFIQAAINRYGADAMAGSSAALAYEAYCYFIIAAFSQATVAFVSQNYGAGQYERCRKVVRHCMLLSLIFTFIATELITLNGATCLRVFTSDSQVIDFGVERMRTVLMFQFLACSYEITGSAMRGLGNSLTPMLLTVFGTCALRLIWIYTVNAHYGQFDVLLYVYPISWIITGALVIGAYLKMARKCLG
ncbi:MAG: MATE family efflux transporter [Firmicutes bacterium]|nr:MATE family efflux transporter [Bacillota bacterium]MCM1401110.1 MATE family efflux transporter [Bacteroides sp.]MCM1477067.1 MATE family efflux transporter [Bacteroides sp.]